MKGLKNYERTKARFGTKGITLVALVVTIVVLLILAGITITLVFSDNGVISKAEKASTETKKSTTEETIRLAVLGSYGTDGNVNISELKANLIDAGLGSYITQESATVLVLNVDGEKYVISGKSVSNISAAAPGNPQQGEIVTTKTEYTDSNGNTAVIPAGFCVVLDSTSIADGLVISDVANDDLANTKGGNQFVWVPVDGTTLKYATHTYSFTESGTTVNDKSGSTPDTAEYGGWKTYYYSAFTDWTETADKDANSGYVSGNGGFYIGRYEAGIPETDATKANNMYASQAGDTYVSSKDVKDVTTYTPVSKKGAPAWNYISQEKAETVAASMYASNTGVKSQLVDSYAWDTVTNWLSDSYDVTNSTTWGNYYDNTPEFNGLYAIHSYNSGWTPATTWSYGATHTRTGNERIELATGISEYTKAKNIYDFAGNMWEWTTEEGKHDVTDGTTTYAVRRGGSFDNSGSNVPACYRIGSYATSGTDISVGFRVVLYVK